MNPYWNSCGTEPRQRVTRMAHLFSNTNTNQLRVPGLYTVFQKLLQKCFNLYLHQTALFVCRFTSWQHIIKLIWRRILDYRQRHRSLRLVHKLTSAKCDIGQPHVIVIMRWKVKHKFVTYGRHFIHMRNMVAEHKESNITNNSWCQNRGLKTNNSAQLYTVYETACKNMNTWSKQQHKEN